MKKFIFALILSLFAATAFADLTPEQVTTLRNLAQADQTAAGYMENGNDTQLAEWFNTPSAFIVWKTAVDPDEIMRNGMDWTRVDNLTNGKARIWDWLTKLGTFDAARANIRAGIDAAWVGTAADLAVRATVYTHCKRPATRAEGALATGVGTTANPGTMVYEGFLSANNEIPMISRGQ